MGEPVPAGERRQWGWEPRAQRCHSFPVPEVLSGLASAPAACLCSYILQRVDFAQVTERFGFDIGLYLNHRINVVYIFISLSRLCTDISKLEALKVWYQWMKTQADQLESHGAPQCFFKLWLKVMYIHLRWVLIQKGSSWAVVIFCVWQTALKPEGQW